MKRTIVLMAMLGMVGAWMPALAGDGDHRLGGGVNYWKALDDIKLGDIDEEGLSYVVSYQYRPSLVGFQLDFELLPDLYGEDAFAPAAYVMVGTGLYLAAGIGVVNRDSKWANDPFYALKTGLDLELLPAIHLDLGLSYRFDSKTKLDSAVKDIDTDTLFMGLAARLEF